MHRLVFAVRWCPRRRTVFVRHNKLRVLRNTPRTATGCVGCRMLKNILPVDGKSLSQELISELTCGCRLVSEHTSICEKSEHRQLFELVASSLSSLPALFCRPVQLLKPMPKHVHATADSMGKQKHKPVPTHGWSKAAEDPLMAAASPRIQAVKVIASHERLLVTVPLPCHPDLGERWTS